MRHLVPPNARCYVYRSVTTDHNGPKRDPEMRNPDAFVQVKIRLKESEHALVAAAAERNGTTMSGEMAARIARTFRDQAAYDVTQMATDVWRFLNPFLENAHKVAMSAEAARAADRMAAVAIESPAGGELREAAEAYRNTVRAAEILARQRLVKIGAPQS
jgi:hypothetical protein